MIENLTKTNLLKESLIKKRKIHNFDDVVELERKEWEDKRKKIKTGNEDE